MSEKDFLSQFSGKNNSVPESFRQEERKPVYKQKKPVNKVLIAVLCAVLLLILAVVYFIFFAPKIEMPNFEGKTKTDVAAWVKQQGVQPSGIIFEEDYYFDYDENVIISQSVDAGKKVKENVKITFISSLGADPDELIKTPDLMNMTKTEIQDWISNNKLTKTKVTTAYSEEVEEGNVISFAYSGCDEDTFTRSSTLKISVSKGPAPAGTIAVEDFTKKTYDYVETWADSKKVKLTKTEKYSDTVAVGLVISQSVESGKTMKEGETLNVVISKGKAIVMENMYEWSELEITRWCTKNGVSPSFTKQYSDEAKDECIYQSIKDGEIVSSGDYIDFVISLGHPNYSDNGGSTYDSLNAWKKEVNTLGAGITINVNEVFSDEPIGTLLTIPGKIKCGSTITVDVSKGKNILIEESYLDGELTWAAADTYDEKQIRKLCEASGITFHISYEITAEEAKIGKVSSISDNMPVPGKYIGESELVEIVIYSNN